MVIHRRQTAKLKKYIYRGCESWNKPWCSYLTEGCGLCTYNEVLGGSKFIRSFSKELIAFNSILGQAIGTSEEH